MIFKNPTAARREQKTSGMLALMTSVMLVLFLQLWLLNIAIEAYLAAHTGLAVPTFLASLFCFALNLAALRYLNIIDKNDS